MGRFFLLAWVWVLLAGPAQAQARFNLALEPRANHGHPLALWARHRAPGVLVQFDSTVFRQGRGSLRLDLAQEEEPLFVALHTYAFPVDSLAGQVVTVSAWVRTRGFRGRAGISAFAGAATTEGLGMDHAEALDSLPADLDWRPLELRLPVKVVAQSFGIGIQARGSGRVWVDDIRVQVAGKTLPDALLPGTELLWLTPTEALTPNWDFERPLPRAARPHPARATAALDSAQPQHGRHYLRLARVGGSPGPAPVIYLGTVPIEPKLLGKSLQISGYWRQSQPAIPGNAPGFSYNLLSTDQGSSYYNDSPTRWGSSAPLAAPALPTPGPQWTAFSFALAVPNDYSRLEALALGLRLPGGAVNLDNLSFSLNGAPYVPAGPPTPPAPTAAEAAWLHTALKPLNLHATTTDFQDLAPLGSLLGAARLVGLGEVTQGSHEVFELKQRLVRYLVGQKSFTGLVLDADPAACAALNAYLQTGRGDPARLLATLDAWETAEMLALVRWLRSYNQAHTTNPVFVASMAVQAPEVSLAQFAQTLDASDDFAQSRLRQLRPLLAAAAHARLAEVDLRGHTDQAADSLLPSVRRLLAELAAGLDTRAKLLRGYPPSLQNIAHQRYYLRLVEQGAVLRRLPPELAADYRAACQAENVQHLRQTESTSGSLPKLLIWAHNAQVARASATIRPVGQWLRATYGPGYFALGLALGQGQVAAQNPNGLFTAAALEAAPNGAYEAWLRTGPPAFLVGLNQVELTEANGWLFQQQLLREVGRRATPHQFGLHSLRNEFDALVFLRESTAARPLP